MKKRTVFVGGIDEKTNEEILTSAFIGFGEIKSVSIPRDYGKDGAVVRLYGFVEYEEEDDAADAIENMNGAVLFDRTLTVNYARQLPTGQQLSRGKAVWTNEEDEKEIIAEKK